MRDRSEDRKDIIRLLGEAIERRGHEVGDHPDRPDPAKLAELTSLLTGGKFSDYEGLRGSITGETDFGALYGNLTDAEHRLKVIGKLAEIGVIPDVKLKSGGFLGSLSRTLTDMTSTDPDLYFYLNELAAQGLRNLDTLLNGPDSREFGEVCEDADRAAEELARRNGLLVERRTDPDKAVSITGNQAFALLRHTDPDVGLTGMQTAMILAAKPGIQGIMRNNFKRSNMAEALVKLQNAGAVPVLGEKPFASSEGAGFLRRMKEAALHVISGPDAGDHMREMIVIGRDVVRARLEDVLREERLVLEPEM